MKRFRNDGSTVRTRRVWAGSHLRVAGSVCILLIGSTLLPSGTNGPGDGGGSSSPGLVRVLDQGPSVSPSPVRAAAPQKVSRARHPSPKPRATRQARSGALLGMQDITAYCVRGTMASGKQTYRGAVATISRSYAFGTRVRIGDLGVFVVEDRIGHSSQWDIWFSSCAEARQFGRRQLSVRIVG